MNKQYVVRRWRLMTWLKNKGYQWIETIPDMNRKDFVCWVYERTPEFDADLKYYFENVVNNGNGVEYNDI